MHTSNCFITLTYAPEHCPKDMSLNYEDFQLFMKRLRKRYTGKTIRFYMAGEYGESFDRPHYHACIFGFDFEDKKVFKERRLGLSYIRQRYLKSFGLLVIAVLVMSISNLLLMLLDIL